MPEPQQTKNADDNSPAAHTQPIERYADLRSKARTSSARELVFGIYHEIQELEQKTGSRVRKRRVQSGARFVDAQRLKREREPGSPFVFTSERGAPFSTAGFARMVERAGGRG